MIDGVISVNHSLCHSSIEILVVNPVDTDRLAEFESVLLVAAVGRIIDVRIILAVIFTAGKDEEFVLDDRSSDSETVGLGVLLIVFYPFRNILSRCCSDEVLIVVVCISRTFHGVGT